MNNLARQYLFNRRSAELVTAAAAYPIGRDDVVKPYLKIDSGFTADDDLLDILIGAAVDEAEKFTNRALITQTWRLWLDFAPGYKGIDSYGAGMHTLPRSYAVSETEHVNLPRQPIQSITSVTTYNEDNTASTYAASNYRLDAAGSRLVLNDNAVWPSDLRDHASIAIEYVAGYGSASDVPAAIRSALLSWVFDMYECRGPAEMPANTKAILSKYKVMTGFGLEW